MMEPVLRTLKALIPAPLFRAAQPCYHYLLALAAALYYRFPSRSLTVIGVTGTKGKSTTLEILNAILEADGRATALAGTIRFKIGAASEPNLEKMTMPGRFFMRCFLARAVRAGCGFALLELTSEGAKQHRHRFISLDALIFTNLAPEHIEAHGSFEAYRDAKLSLARALERSGKRARAVIANADDECGERFLAARVEHRLPYSRSMLEHYELRKDHLELIYRGQPMHAPLRGEFNLMNVLAAVVCAEHFGVPLATIARALHSLPPIPGRVELIEEGQPFSVVVDYAHTPESLEELYGAFARRRKLCVMGATGGGRDRGKRARMGALAERHCDVVVLTNEDPYDEDPERIVADVASGMKAKPEIIMDRRAAIRRALALAEAGDAVLITGKGTDPYIMEAASRRTPWSDARVAREELAALLAEERGGAGEK